MKHGEVRKSYQETKYSDPVTLQDAKTGKTIFQGPLSSCTYTVEEKWCEKCSKWILAKGIIGFIICPECKTEW